jgi:hypothetical protein
VWGTTAAGDYLQVVFEFLPEEEADFKNMSATDVVRCMDGEEVIYVIHAMPTSENMKSRLKSRLKKKGHRSNLPANKIRPNRGQR